jgi:type III secretion YscU/HrpY family protein
MAEKSEKATPKKLRDARKKGQVAKAQDLPSAFTFIASVAITVWMAPWLYDKLSVFITSIFKLVNHGNLSVTISQLFFESALVIFLCSIPILGAACAIGIIVNFLVVGPTFAVEAMKFDIKKLNPIQNLKQKFKMRTLVELLKSVIKISIATYIIYLVVYKSLPVLITAVTLPITGSLLIFKTFLLEVVIKVGLFFLVIAVADLIYQKHDFAKEMKMEKFEVKQEYKDTEGNPEIKGKRKQLAQEIAYQSGPAANIKRSQAVITNPTHLAIAIAYDKEVDLAPYILEMGEGPGAEMIIKLAKQFDIPIMRNIPLAHNLWENGDILQYVPEDTYQGIVEVLKWVESLKTGGNDTVS